MRTKEWHTAKSFKLTKERWNQQIEDQINVDLFFVSFDRRGIVYKNFFSPGQTVKQVFYIDVFDKINGCSIMTILHVKLPSS